MKKIIKKNEEAIAEFSRFLITGTIGFIVDAALLYISMMFLDAYTARAISFSCAVACTWTLNSRYTFREKKGSFVQYLTAQSSGLAINYGIYTILILLIGNSQTYALISLTVASATAMLANYIALKFWVFKNQ